MRHYFLEFVFVASRHIYRAWSFAALSRPQCLHGDCGPGNDFCGQPFENTPVFHLIDQHGCGENDPNGPVFDPVHGVVHYFYQKHLAAPPGAGPIYGHFVSKDFVHWAALPTAIWNGLDSSVNPPIVTPYDNQAIYSGSAFVIEGGGPGGEGPGVVNIYPGLCDSSVWPQCQTGYVLCQAIPADYANDVLLVNWTKPSYNPIMENTERDPSSPWKTPSGEWRLRTFDSKVYAAGSDADVLAGKWYEVGLTADFKTCECPSFYPLPESTPGFEEDYDAAKEVGSLPTHVHKTSCSGAGNDFWQLGTYDAGIPRYVDHFTATPGYEDLFEQKQIDRGFYYASKDNIYPTQNGGKRRINWGWVLTGPEPKNAQALPRVITFNAKARTLEQAPIDELEKLRGPAAYSAEKLELVGMVEFDLGLPRGIAKQSEVVATFALPALPTKFGIEFSDGSPSNSTVGRFMNGTDIIGEDYNKTYYPPSATWSDCQAACREDARCEAWTYAMEDEREGRAYCSLKSGISCPTPSNISISGAKQRQTFPACGFPATSSVTCTIDYKPSVEPSAQFYEVPIECSNIKNTLRLVREERTVEIRAYADWIFMEVFFQKGRVAMTVINTMHEGTRVSLITNGSVDVQNVTAYPMKSIWTSAENVRLAPRIYPERDLMIQV